MNDHRISTPVVLLGLVVIAGILSATVAGLHLLVNPGEQLQPLDAPVPAHDRCNGPVPAAAGQPIRVTAGELLECPHVFDGIRVRYTGEVVRAVLDRGERAVAQLNDDPYALDLGPLPDHRTAVGGNSGIPVVLSQDDAAAITVVGDYRHHGDVLAIEGTYRAADPYDGGGPTISADSATVRRPGVGLEHRVDPLRAMVAGLLAAVTLGLAAATRVSTRA